MKWSYGMSVLEALLLASPEPLSIKRIAEIMELDEKDATILLDDLRKEYQQAGRGIYIREMAGGYTLTTLPEHAKYVEKLLQPKGKGLSHAALETLAIIAYRQPITRAEIEGVRGVQAGSSLETLLERRLVKELGRKETPGRPMLYGTTKEFLQYFGLGDLADLPPIALDTTDAGLILRNQAEQAESDEESKAS